jgi:predicted membrane protein
MDPAIRDSLLEALKHVQGYIYPNDLSLWWSVVIVVYPFLTGLVAGAFILASLVRVFNVSALTPVYRLSLLAALAFLIVAPVPLLVHLGHPERCYEVLMTPHTSSPMAIFGFVYAWYLMAVLLLELWLDYRKDFVLWSKSDPNPLKRLLFSCLTLGVTDISEPAIRFDDRMGRFITIVGIPSAFILHGYVGFIFGSIKANPWWGNVLMPIIFIFSAMVSGIALMAFLYQVLCLIRRKPMDMACLETIGKALFFALLIDGAIESLDWIHRLYQAEESLDTLVLLVSRQLRYSFLLIQVGLGTVLPLTLLGVSLIFRRRISDSMIRLMSLLSSILVIVGVFAMRWNVVIGGQLFSKSLRGFTTYKIHLIGSEGLLMSITLLIAPFVILAIFLSIFHPMDVEKHAMNAGHGTVV